MSMEHTLRDAHQKDFVSVCCPFFLSHLFLFLNLVFSPNLVAFFIDVLFWSLFFCGIQSELELALLVFTSDFRIWQTTFIVTFIEFEMNYFSA